MKEAKQIPISVIYDVEKDQFVISAKSNMHYLVLNRKETERQITEGVLEEIGRSSNEQYVFYGVSVDMQTIELRIQLTKDIVAQVLGNWLVTAVDCTVRSFNNIDVLIPPEELPLTVTVHWSMQGFVPYSINLPEEKDL